MSIEICVKVSSFLRYIYIYRYIVLVSWFGVLPVCVCTVNRHLNNCLIKWLLLLSNRGKAVNVWIYWWACQRKFHITPLSGGESMLFYPSAQMRVDNSSAPRRLLCRESAILLFLSSLTSSEQARRRVVDRRKATFRYFFVVMIGKGRNKQAWDRVGKTGVGGRAGGVPRLP